MSQPGPIYNFITSFPPFSSLSIPSSLLYFTPQTPFSSIPSILIALCTYLTIIFSGRYLMKGRSPISSSNPLLKWPFFIHNVALSGGSALLLALILEEILPIWRRNGPWYAVCGEGAWTVVSFGI